MKKKLYSFLLAAFLATTSQFAAADITSALKMHYTFDQVDSTEAKVPYFADQTSNHLDGIVEGKITLGNGMSTATGKAVSLTDTMNRVRVPGSLFESVTDFTVAFWINQSELAKWSRIFDFGSNRDHYMFIATDGDVGDFLRFEMDVDYDKNDLTMFKANKTLTLKKWNHVAVTGAYSSIAEGDTSSVVNIYINGMLAGSTTKFKLAPYMIGTTTYSRIGGSQWQDPSCKALMDDFRFYQRALSEADIEELSGVSAAQKAALASLDIPAPSRTEMMPGTSLTLPLTYEGFDVTWSTTDSTVITKTGVPQHSDISITDAYLTAALSPTGQLYPMTEKTFFVTVYPLQDPINVIAKYNFVSDSIFNRNDSLFIKSEGELPYEAFTVGGAQILPIGNEAGEEGIDFFNVFVTDNRATTSANKQWLDLGKPIGEMIYKLRDHSISLFYRRDSTVDHRVWSQDAGQLLWAFSNSQNLNSYGGTGAAQPWGAMYFEPNECNVCILDAATETVNLNALKWGLAPNTGKTPIGNSWHNIAYTQTNGQGYLLVDAIQVVTGVMPAPKVQLRKNSNVATYKGTPYNRLAGEMHTNRITSKNTMLYGFTLLSFGMPAEECDDYFAITETLGFLDEAIANTTYNVNAYMALLPAMVEARKTLKIGFHTEVETALQAVLAIAVTDSTNRLPSDSIVEHLNAAIKTYTETSADWVKMKGVLGSFADERALNYPGLPVLEEKIALVQASYDEYVIDTEMFAFLDAAVLEYQKSQVATSEKPANYTFMVANPRFEEGTGGKQDPKTSGGPSLVLPKGWTVLYNSKSGQYAKTGLQTNVDNPMEGTADFEVWSGAIANVYHTDIYQVTNEPLAAGWYVLSGDIRAGEGTKGGQHLYAYSIVDSIIHNSDTLEADKPGYAWQGGYGWVKVTAAKKVFVKFKSVGDKYRLGFTADSFRFYKMDDVKLAYFGPSDNEPTLGDVTSYIKNAGFETGARATELDGFAATTNVTAASGDVFAPKDWTMLATISAPTTTANINVLASGATEGSNMFRMFGETLNNVKLSQIIYAPSSGMYKLNAYVRADSACRSDARLFAQVGRRIQEGSKLMTAVDTSLIFTGWKKLEYTFRAAVTDEVTLGLISAKNIEVDNFMLELYSNVAVGIKGTPEVGNSTFKPYAKDGVIYIPNVTSKDRVSVYDIAGRQISVKNNSQIKVSKGMYMIKINNEVIKQLVK